MKISVIICTYNGGRRLPAVLASLSRQQGLVAASWEVLVVGEASTDDAREVGGSWWSWIYQQELRAAVTLLHTSFCLVLD